MDEALFSNKNILSIYDKKQFHYFLNLLFQNEMYLDKWFVYEDGDTKDVLKSSKYT